MSPAPPEPRSCPRSTPGPGQPESGPALATVLERQRPALRRYLRVLGCPLDRFDDLVQETALVVLRADFVHRSDAATGAFVRHTARNLFLRQLRDARQRREVEIADEVWQTRCGDGDGDDYVAALRACVEALPERQRRLLTAAYDERMSRSELARRAGLRPEGVKTALRRLRAALRTCIERKRGSR